MPNFSAAADHVLRLHDSFPVSKGNRLGCLHRPSRPTATFRVEPLVARNPIHRNDLGASLPRARLGRPLAATTRLSQSLAPAAFSTSSSPDCRIQLRPAPTAEFRPTC
jgi:hypothetical protein